MKAGMAFIHQGEKHSNTFNNTNFNKFTKKSKWEMVEYALDSTNRRTERLKVIGGLLVRVEDTIKDNVQLVFLPDANHDWEI
jgi:hypothetical protein